MVTISEDIRDVLSSVYLHDAAHIVKGYHVHLIIECSIFFSPSVTASYESSILNSA